MKLYKFITINDGREEALHNGNFFYIEEYPRTQKILEALAQAGWKIISMNPIYSPNGISPNAYPFYRGGFRYLFEKEAEDASEDDFYEVFNSTLEELLSDKPRTVQEEEEDFEEFIEFDDSDYEDFKEYDEYYDDAIVAEED